MRSLHGTRRRHRRLHQGASSHLAKANYKGWLVQEAEQDPRLFNPKIYAELGNAHLRATAQAAKLKRRRLRDKRSGHGAT